MIGVLVLRDWSKIQPQDKHVESLRLPCLDRGSTPLDSTKTTLKGGFFLVDYLLIEQCKKVRNSAF